ncbi:Serine/threonine protein kinase [Nannocystis exedens]|uniref:Serine/threonine protein kinase n=1 Tax=Nannocystis exedens TaxID=54 RepID=A0A1I2FE14_9BACT|nr:serine/threonine-protein kinase [Nannocystis exedens]PCC70501.1 Serine/threonine-protein kinase PrkC [Nannocystis exedens]SFF03233.1 Serine/threonine protein kinase [Nannocystis exedens]
MPRNYTEALGSVETIARELADTTSPRLAFPGLDGPDEQRMEDLLVARLFPREAAPLRIGRYSLLDRIGQGGMGMVYSAYDPELDRRVAIKLLGAALSAGAEERLVREAQAMARVVHANVVSVIEVGRDRGQAYVVMEYLRGVSLDRWAERRPGWRATLGVYVQAGRGLAAAHRAGVIHRDFKPHNAMLVEGGVDDGRVKVLDFGLARAAALASPVDGVGEPIGGALATPLTRTGALMGTPAYMAPEQLEGEPASERSDQFSFAVSLYEALYGQLPFDARSLAALTQALRAGAVRPPPAGTDVPTWVLRVVLRGLSRDPAQRHPSMAAMCDALEHEPGARRRTVLLSLGLSAAVGASVWGATQGPATSPCSGPAFELHDLWNEARRAEMEAAFVATGSSYAAEAARRVQPIVADYADAWSSMRKDACEAHRRGEQSPQLLDLRMTCLDRRRAGFASLTDLLTHADATVVERAVEAALQLPGLDGCGDVEALLDETPLPDEPERARAVEAARGRLAELEALAGAGRFAEAAAGAEEVLARAEALGFSPLVAESSLALGKFELDRRRGEQAERAFTRAVQAGIEGRADRVVAEAVSRRLFVRGVFFGTPERAADDGEWAAALAARFPREGTLQWLAAMNRGAVAYTAHDFAAARRLYEQALAVTEGPTPLDLARTRINLGLLAHDVRDVRTALAWYTAATAQAEETLGAAHPLVAQLGIYEAKTLMGLGRKRAARARLEAALAHGGEPGAGDIWPLLHLSLLDIQLRRFAAARERASRALALTDSADVLTWVNGMLYLATATVDPAEARVLHERTVQRVRATYGEGHQFLASFLYLAAADLLRRGRAGEALPWLREALAISEEVDGVDATPTAEIRSVTADALLALGERDEALTAAKAAVAALSAIPGEPTLDLAAAQRSLGRVHLARDEAPLAVEALRAALALFERHVDEDDPDLAAARVDLARGSLALSPSCGPEVRRLLVQARDVYAGHGEPFAPESAEVLRLLADCRK